MRPSMRDLVHRKWCLAHYYYMRRTPLERAHYDIMGMFAREWYHSK